MKKIVKLAAAGVAALSFGVSSAMAAPVLWTLQDVTFGDGATASGSFVYDADVPFVSGISGYSSINVTVSGGTVFPATTYDGFNASSPGNASYASFTVGGDISDGALALDLIFESLLTDAGGTVAIVVPAFYSSQGVCATQGGAQCLGSAGPTNPILSGFVTTEAVPLPAAAWLMLSGVAGLAAARRRVRTG